MNSKSNNYIAVVLLAAGLLLIVLAWNGAASVDTIQQQFPYLISGGLAGVGLIAAAIGLMLVQEMRRGTAQIEAKLQQLIEAQGGASDQANAALVASGTLTERQRRALERAGAN